jgi:hypothetical protein
VQVLTDHQGRSIRLTAERLAHILEHPEMAGPGDRVAETLADPDTVVESVSDASVVLYYRRYASTPVGSKWLCTVVKVLPGDAFVITAYLTDRIKRGTVLWQRNR